MTVFRKIPWLALLFLFPFFGFGQNCGCQDCGINIPVSSDEFHDFIINDLVNDNLSDPTQGICGVELHFTHNRVQGIEVTLISPSGQEVRLIGTSFQFPTINTTTLANWDITFLRTQDPASPDPGFNGQWTNNDPWAAVGKYIGTYHPNSGNLEDFNSGSANGTWRLRIENENFFNNYTGELIGFRLIFCDPTGISCCFAEAGEIAGTTELDFCENDPNLLIEPNLIINLPDTNLHDFRWLIGNDSIIVKYDSIVDLRAFPPGAYEICALSYLKTDFDSLPIPNGIVRWDDLKDTIEQTSPPFCADISDQCLQVIINAPPAPTPLIDSFCFGKSYPIGDSIFSAAGNYNVVFQLANGCDSLVRLNLRESVPDTTFLNEVICVNETFPVGTKSYAQTGIYIDTFPSNLFCDSIVKLDLTVLPEIDTTLNPVICEGDTILVGGRKLFTEGFHEITTTAIRGLNCDSTIRINLSILEPQALIDIPDLITCDNPQVPLTGINSFPSGNLSFAWQTTDGDIFSDPNFPRIIVSDSGTYELIVTQDSLGVSCADSETIKVELDKSLPNVSIEMPDTITCDRPSITIDGSRSSSGDFNFSWREIGVGMIPGATSNQLIVSNAGDFELIVINNQTGCKDSLEVRVQEDITLPIAEAGDGFELNCSRATGSLNGTGSSTNDFIEYQWTGPGITCCGMSLQPTINQEGRYYLTVTNSKTGCSAIDSVDVSQDENLPFASLPNDQVLNCRDSILEINGNGSLGSQYVFSWNSPSGTNFQQINSSTIEIREVGEFVFTVLNSDNNCEKSDTILITRDIQRPNSDAGPDSTLTCTTTSIELGGPNTDIGSDFFHIWYIDNVPQSGGNNPEFIASEPGVYLLEVLNGSNFCRDSSEVLISIDTFPPGAIAGSPFQIDCITTFDTLFGQTNFSLNNLEFEWRTDTGCINTSTNQSFIELSCDGNYWFSVTNLNNGCISSDSVFISQDANLPRAVVVEETLMLRCNNYQVTIDGSGSTFGNQIGYQWSLNNDSISNQITTMVSEPGNYLLEVIDSSNNCVAINSVFVRDTVSPIIIIPSLIELDCNDLENGFVLDASGSSQGVNFSYNWVTANGSFISRTDTLTPVINSAGLYNLVIENLENGCSSELDISVRLDGVPDADAGADLSVACGIDSILIDGGNSSSGAGIQYQWTTLGGRILSDNSQNFIYTDSSGRYIIEVWNTLSNCIKTDTVNVVFEPCSPFINVLADTVTCNQKEVRLDASSSNLFNGRLEWMAIDGVILADADTPFPLVTAGRYELILTDTTTNLFDRFQIDVPVDTLHPQAFAGSDKILTCNITSAILEGDTTGSIRSNLLFDWIGPGQIIPQDSLRPEINDGGRFLLRVTNSENGCFDTSSVLVGYDTLSPLANAGIDLSFPCDPDSLILDGTGSDTGTNFSISWNFGSTDIEPVIRQPGTYCIEVENLTNGCKSEDCVDVTPDDNAPQISVSNDETFTCKDTLFELSVNLPTGNLELFWESQDGCFISDSLLQNVEVNCPGEYTVVVKNLDNQCISTETIQVIPQLNFPIANAGNTDTLNCTGANAILDGTGSDQGSNFEYNWSGNSIVSGQNSLQPEIDQIGEYILEVIDTSNGCISIDTVNVVPDTIAPLANAGVDLELDCRADTLQLNGTLSSITNDYNWATNGGRFVSGQSTLQPEIDRPGTYILEVTDSNNGCTAVDSVEVESLDDLPFVDFGGTVSTEVDCRNENIVLNGENSTPQGGLIYRWATTQGSIASNPIDASVTVSEGGWYVLTIERTDNGCILTDSIFVIENKIFPAISTALPTSINCDSTEVFLEAFVSDTLQNYDVGWSTQFGNFTQGTDTLTTWVDEPGRYLVSVIDVDNGCKTETSVLVEADTLAPIASAEVSGFLDCFITNVELDGSGSSTDSTVVYQWFTNGVGNISNPNSLFPTVDAIGKYFLEVRDNRNGCISTDSVVVSEEAAGIQNFQINTEDITCYEFSDGAIRIDSIEGGTPPFLYSINGGSFGNFGQFAGLEAGEYEVLIQDAAGCESDTTIILNSGLDLLIDLGPDQTIQVGDSLELEALLNIPFSRIGDISWNQSLDSSCNNCLTQMVSPFISTEFIITVADSNGCVSSDDIFINVLQDRPVYFPSAFSPNGDGNNDLFIIYGNENISAIHSFLIFDRWGNIVHSAEGVEPNNPKFGWDGKFNNKEMNGGVYVYFAKIEFPDGKVEVFSGDVTLYR